MLTGCPPGVQEMDRVLARLAEAEAPARQKMTPCLLWGSGRSVTMPIPSVGPALHRLPRKALEWGGGGLRESVRSRGPEGGGLC